MSHCGCDHNEVCDECMPKPAPRDAEITRLSLRVAELTEGLKPFSDAHERFNHEGHSDEDIYMILAGTGLEAQDLRRARTLTASQ